MKTNKPNILFILADQHNAKVLGHKGHPDVKTPNLDRLTAEGVRFNNAISQNPICTPSRVSWLSGQYCHNHGYYGLSGANPGGLPTIIGHFRRHGYKTAAIGKIHCPEYWIEDDSDVFLETCPGCSISGNLEYNAYLKEKGLLDDHAALTEFGKKGMQSCDARASNLSYEDSHEGWIVNQAKKIMGDNMDKGNSFFLHVSLPKPHQCYTPSEPFWSMYDESKITLPPNADYEMEGKAPHLRSAAEGWRKWEWSLFEPKTFEAARLRKLHGYLGNISHVDYSVGELVKWVDENGLAENTIIVYSSDHGDYACEHGIMEKAPGICSDAITRIPFIWRWKGKFKEGNAVEEIVETVDLSLTLCRLAGVEDLETSDGKDISRLLEGENINVHKVGVTEFVWSKSLRKGRFRYVYYPKVMFVDEYPDGFGELYDLRNDPWEMKNLYFDIEYTDIIKELKDDLLDFLVTTTRPKTVLPTENVIGDQKLTRYHNTTNRDGKMNPEMIRLIATKNYL